MTEPLDLSPAELEGMLAVLKHPEHQRGLGERSLTVIAIEHRAQALVRIVATISGEDLLDAWDLPNPTIRISMPEPPEELAAIPGAPQTTSRVYTLADVDIDDRMVQIDLVRHGQNSPAMRWLDALTVGDRLHIVGPRPHRTPGDGRPRVLLADSSALPAATRILRTMPGVQGTLVIAAVPEDEFALFEHEIATGQGQVTAHRQEPGGQNALTTAFAELDLPSTSSVWASGERDDMRQIRRRCKYDLGLPPGRTQVFGYWKKGITNTRLDFARLRAAQQALAGGGRLSDVDDFEIEL